jgi:putative DNA primase/helicase
LIHKHFENTNNEDLACLRGQRLVEVSETNKSHELNEQQVKSLTGEDFITASLKYQSLKGTEFVPTHTIWLRTNTKPKIYGTDPAIWRRPKIILFPLRFVAAIEYRALVASNASLAASLRILDSGLSDALRAELQGVLAWAVKGAVLWWNKGAPNLRTPSIVTSAVEEYRSDEDRLGRFIDECGEADAAVTTPLKAIYPIYRKWAEAKGIKPWSDVTLSMHLDAAGFKMSRTKTGSQCAGLKLNPSVAENTMNSLEDIKRKNRKFNK